MSKGTTAGADADDASYSGLVGAFPYAFRQSRSRLFRAYVVLGGGLAALLAVLFGAGVVVTMADTAGVAGGTFTFVRAFVVLVGLLVVFPLVAPVVFAARHHRRFGGDARHDRALAATGFLFAFSLYVGLLVSTPASSQASVSGALAPVVEFLYGLPRIAGLLPPVAAAAAVYLAHRRYR